MEQYKLEVTKQEALCENVTRVYGCIQGDSGCFIDLYTPCTAYIRRHPSIYISLCSHSKPFYDDITHPLNPTKDCIMNGLVFVDETEKMLSFHGLFFKIPVRTMDNAVSARVSVW